MNSTLNSNTLNELLTKAIDCVSTSFTTQVRLLEKLHHLQDRLKTERFQLAVLGQFKRGKSTLLNALLGIDILPTAVVPLTAIPTFLQDGTSYRLQITYQDNRVEDLEDLTPEALRERLNRYVAEEANPQNRLGVDRVDVYLPSPLLKLGVVLIDTPGVGSTFQHNTETAEIILPECDAALFVVSPDPPITAVEIAYLSQIRPHVAHLIIVLNKVDILDPEDRIQAERFLKQVLKENTEVTNNAPIFSVSGRNALRAIGSHDEAALRKSGLPELESYLINFLAQNKQTTLSKAIARKASAIVGNLQFENAIALKALSLPVEVLQNKLAFFDQAVQQFEEQRRITHDLLMGDQKRLLIDLEEEAEALRRLALMEFGPQLEKLLAQEQDAQTIRQTLAATVPVFFKSELERLAQNFQSRLGVILGIHQQRVNELIGQVRQTASDLMEIQGQAPDSTEAFERNQEPYWVLSGQTMTPNIIQPGFVDQFLPKEMRKTRLKNRLVEEIKELVLHNVENLRWATRQNIDDAFRRFANGMGEALIETSDATRKAMTEALERQNQQATQLDKDIQQKRFIAETLENIQGDLKQFN